MKPAGTLLRFGLAFALACGCSDPVSRDKPGGERSDAGEIDLARDQPDSTRDAIARQLRQAAAAPTQSEIHLAGARRLAHAYAEAWKDSFFVRRVARFEAATAWDRRNIADADSLWRAARLASGQEGIPAAMQLWKQSLRLAEAANDSAGVTAALYGIGTGFYNLSELDSATFYVQRAYDLARGIGDHRMLGNAVGMLANVSKDGGELRRAAELYEQAAAIRPLSGDVRGTAADENNLGLIALGLGDLDEANAAFDRALALNRAGGRDRPAAVNLSNLGDVATLRGDYAAAESYYKEALALNRSLGDAAETGFVLHDLGLLATRRGDYNTAIAVLSEALRVHEAAGAELEVVSVRSDLAIVQAAAGDFETAIETLDRAATTADHANAPSGIQAALALARADLAVQLGQPARADADYARAEQLYRETGNAAGLAEAQQGRGVLLLLREDYAGALRLLELAARTRSSTGDLRSAAIGQLLTGDVHRERGDTAAARRDFTAAHKALSALGDRGGAAAALSSLGDLALRRGAPLQAESFYRNGLERLGTHGIPDVRWRLHAGLAGALRSRGALEPAAREFQAAINSIETVAGNLRLVDRRTGFLSDKWEVYAALARVEQARNRPAAAFAISEQMRARQMLAMLDRAQVKSRHESNAREQDLRRRIRELTEEVAAASPVSGERHEPGLSERTTDAAREALAAAQKEYADLLLDLKSHDPAYASMVSGEFVDWQAAAARLHSDELLLQYLLTDSAATVFVVTRDTVVAIDLGATRKTIADLVDFARRALNRPQQTETARLWRAPLRRLYDYLIEPVERAGYLEGRHRIVVIPHAELHFLPLGALLSSHEKDTFLIERFQLTHAPSASVWVRLAARRAKSTSLLALAPHTSRLPASQKEVNAIRANFGRRRATVFTGSAASESAFRSTAARHGIVHFATFGVLNKHNPLFSYVELAPGRGQDGRLEVHEVFDLPLDGQLIVLSACQTAVASGVLADVPAGDDWVGLMQAFLQAGAGSVLASLWPVDDAASATLMSHFYRALVKAPDDAAALAQAQKALLSRPETAHPFYWAGFVLNGNRMNAQPAK